MEFAKNEISPHLLVMDMIRLNNMAFYAYHGVEPEEKKLGQKFFVDLKFELDLAPAGLSDSVTDTVSYVDVYDVVKAIVEQQCFCLIEALAEAISKSVLALNSKILSVTVVIKKQNAPFPGVFDNVSVEITRTK